jgi:hypothetical protein
MDEIVPYDCDPKPWACNVSGHHTLYLVTPGTDKFVEFFWFFDCPLPTAGLPYWGA